MSMYFVRGTNDFCLYLSLFSFAPGACEKRNMCCMLNKSTDFSVRFFHSNHLYIDICIYVFSCIIHQYRRFTWLFYMYVWYYPSQSTHLIRISHAAISFTFASQYWSSHIWRKLISGNSSMGNDCICVRESMQWWCLNEILGQT